MCIRDRIIGLKWRDFLLHAFDPTQAKASGLRGGLLHYGLLCMIALTIVATLQSVGIIDVYKRQTLFIAVGIAASLAKHHHLDSLTAGMLSLMSFLLVAAPLKDGQISTCLLYTSRCV